MRKKYISSILYLIVFFLFIACASEKDVLYLQDIKTYGQTDSVSKNNIKFKKNDELTITVSSADRKSAVLFNLPLTSEFNGGGIANLQSLQSYLVDEDGNIQFPILGEVKVLGLSKIELRKLLELKISKFVKDPIVNIRIINFRVSVIGEVRKPGVYRVQGERMSVIECLSQAGDMTVYGKRKNIVLVRENDKGVKEYHKLDITSSKILDSEYYYLEQNDVIMVSPNKAQIQASAFNRNTTVYFSVASLLLSLLTIIGR